MSPTLESFTPPRLARLWQVKPVTVLEWIRAGELAAFDVAKKGSKRPRCGRFDPCSRCACRESQEHCNREQRQGLGRRYTPSHVQDQRADR